jgi:hypothetical protein
MALLRKGAIRSLQSRIDYALNFDGVDDYVEIPSSDSLNITNAITIMGWFFWKGRTGTIQNGIRKGFPISGPFAYIDTYQLFWWADTTGFEYAFAVYDPDGYAYNINLGFDPEEEITNKWTHWAGVFDGSQLRLYINSVLRGSLDYTGTIAITDSPLYIGKEGAGFFFNGIIDEVRIYNRALTLAEIQKNMLAKTPVLNGLVLWLPMNEGTSNTVHDKSGQGNNGTLLPNYPTNAPTWTRR